MPDNSDVAPFAALSSLGRLYEHSKSPYFSRLTTFPPVSSIVQSDLTA